MNNHFFRTNESYKWKTLETGLILMGLTMLLWFGIMMAAHAADPGLDDILSKGDFKTQKLGYELLGGHNSLVIQAEPRNKRVAKSLGYSRIRAWYDTVDQLTRKIVLLDAKGNRLSTVVFIGMSTIKGKKRATQMEVTNHSTGQVCKFNINGSTKLVKFM
jgi:hypothetical protein